MYFFHNASAVSPSYRLCILSESYIKLILGLHQYARAMTTIEYQMVRRDLRVRMVRNFLPMLVLNLLKEKAISGYEVMSEVYREFGTLLSPGTVYPVLAYMESKGWVKGSMEEKKKVYRLTPEGSSMAIAMTGEYLKITSGIDLSLST